jgi:uncharacterized membrane protein YhhN
MWITLLSALVFISAILHLRAEHLGRKAHIYLFKPLTMFFIILIALQTKNAVSSFYKYTIVCGLVFSLAGDIFLMLPADRFIAGLVSFLLAHLFYIAAFTFEGTRAPGLLTSIPFLIYGALMLSILLPHLGGMKAPVTIYMLVISLMAGQALNRWLGGAEQGSALALAGALLFVVSDSLLAMNRFKRPFQNAQLYIMSTYFMAQWLIALSN